MLYRFYSTSVLFLPGKYDFFFVNVDFYLFKICNDKWGHWKPSDNKASCAYPFIINPKNSALFACF